MTRFLHVLFAEVINKSIIYKMGAKYHYNNILCKKHSMPEKIFIVEKK